MISRFTSNVRHTVEGKVTYLRCHHASKVPSMVTKVSDKTTKKSKKLVPYCTAYMNVGLMVSMVKLFLSLVNVR